LQPEERYLFLHLAALRRILDFVYRLTVLSSVDGLLFAVDPLRKGRYPMSDLLSELLEANQRAAAGFTQGSLAMPPARKLAIVTCMDARVEPLSALGLRLGDAHVIRNAGGRTAEAVRSLVISQQLLGTEAVLVIHHTDCGMLTFSNEQLRERVQQTLGPAAHTAAQPVDFQPFGDLAQSVRDDVALLKASPLIPDHLPIYGLIYDVRTGKLEPVA
jgi:carbonic anhydrase